MYTLYVFYNDGDELIQEYDDLSVALDIACEMWCRDCDNELPDIDYIEVANADGFIYYCHDRPLEAKYRYV